MISQLFNEYIDMLTSQIFYPLITLSTRLSKINVTIMDNFLFKIYETTLDRTSGILIYKLSEHQPYLQH